MIFVILGTERFPFNRLVREVDHLVGDDMINDSVFIQLGFCTYEPIHCKWERFLSFGDMCERIKEATLIIAHAGAGTTLLCLQYGKKPILVPRQRKFKEHVDNHQVIFAEKMQELGRANIVFNVNKLANLVHTYTRLKVLKHSTKSATSELSLYLKDLLISWENR